jgi:threonine/homoserine/homoserine lactone efflux protein
MALTALTVYVGTRDFITVLGVAVIFGVINLPSVGIWTAMGQYIRRRLAGDLSRRLFNWGMAALLVASLTVAL